jgi:hypothetical protein
MLCCIDIGTEAGLRGTGDIKHHSPVRPRSDEGEVVHRTYGFSEGDLKRVTEVKMPFPPASCFKVSVPSTIDVGNMLII